MEYNFSEIESKWRQYWAVNKTFKAEDGTTQPKYYVLDMFPYPSGAGLHVGHPLGYIASDIYARYKRHKGFNVLHPMGYDSFGLPAEQYAIQTGQHPSVTTKTNIDGGVDKDGNEIPGYRKQLDILGFSFDWDREVRTSNPDYYKWTQWIFKQLFDCYYDNDLNKAVQISELIATFEKEGNANVNAYHDCEIVFTAEEWNHFSEKEKENIIQTYRLAFLADSWVNWCPALGTVLANDEIVNGVSERGGHPVEQKLMRQWSMRIKAYAERLITGLDGLDWVDSIKEIQRNWIGKSVGCSVKFQVDGVSGASDNIIEVFTTRPDTIFGVSFMVLAPEHPLVDAITTPEFEHQVAEYKKNASLKSERDRQSDVKNITGQNTGAFAIHPFSGEKIQIWIGDYVLASYGTGAVMAVPCGDQRDYDFAKHFGIEIKNIFENIDVSEAAYSEKTGKIAHSDFLSGLEVKEAMQVAIAKIEEKGIGKGKTNYRLRDAVFSRQRYWGEPFPVYYQDGLPKMIDTKFLPIILPEVEKYLPTEDGKPPLGNAHTWAWDSINNTVVDTNLVDNKTIFPIELNTMPGWAGSSWYFLRYMDPKNENEFVNKEKADYWKNVDLYIGGSEHATGHLLYARFWTKFLFDQGFISFDEPFQKMINQGMILGRSSFVYLIYLSYTIAENGEDKVINDDKIFIFSKNKYNSNSLSDEILENRKDELNNILPNIGFRSFTVNHIPMRVDISLVDNDLLDLESFKKSNVFKQTVGEKEVVFITEDNGDYICGHEVEKMSKSKFNVQTPDELVEKFGADTLRMYEMFLGPLEQFKPWDTKGINGVHNFLRKLWRLFHNENGELAVTEGQPEPTSLKTLHKTIKKLTDDLERFSFNTPVSAFMIAVNELSEQKCSNKTILNDLLILLSPFAPHIAEELWSKLGNTSSISKVTWPEFNAAYLVENTFEYPVSFNGKMRFKIALPTNMNKEEVEKEVLSSEQAKKYLEGVELNKIIVVPNRIVNVVVK
jgi:leucyl-tRNA synthetase